MSVNWVDHPSPSRVDGGSVCTNRGCCRAFVFRSRHLLVLVSHDYLRLEIKWQHRGTQRPLFSVPCSAVFPLQPDRFVATSKRHDEYLKTFEPEKQEDEDVEDGEHVSQGEAAPDAKAGGGSESSSEESASADSGVTTVGRTETARGGRRASTAPPGREGSSGEKEKERVATAISNAAGDGLSRPAERDLIKEQLEKEALEIFNEMKECMIFHDLQ